jgi:hypothetical protein
VMPPPNPITAAATSTATVVGADNHSGDAQTSCTCSPIHRDSSCGDPQCLRVRNTTRTSERETQDAEYVTDERCDEELIDEERRREEAEQALAATPAPVTAATTADPTVLPPAAASNDGQVTYDHITNNPVVTSQPLPRRNAIAPRSTANASHASPAPPNHIVATHRCDTTNFRGAIPAIPQHSLDWLQSLSTDEDTVYDAITMRSLPAKISRHVSQCFNICSTLIDSPTPGHPALGMRLLDLLPRMIFGPIGDKKNQAASVEIRRRCTDFIEGRWQELYESCPIALSAEQSLQLSIERNARRGYSVDANLDSAIQGLKMSPKASSF